MADRNEGVPVARIAPRKSRVPVTVGRPKKRKTLGSFNMYKKAYGAGGGGSFGGGGPMGTITGSGGNFYSPELSPDYLELPQSLDEKRSFFRFFYKTNEFVGQAIDQHTELPLSRTRLRMAPDAKDKELAKRSLKFCEKWTKSVNFFQQLLYIAHEYWKLGECFIFMEDASPELPQEVRYDIRREVSEDGETKETLIEREDADERHAAWNQKNYRGWTDMKILPPEQVHMESFSFTEEKLFELIPDSKVKKIIEQAQYQDDEALKIVKTMPKEIVASVLEGKNIPLNTDPTRGSFVYYLARKRSGYEERGVSIIERCIRTLVYADKLRQAQTSIASRHMTPIRILWVENGDEADVEDLRDQVDLALQDPDYSIIANYQINWEERSSNDRLLDLSSENDIITQKLMAGMSVTTAQLTGESSYSGDRISLSIINDRYLLFREFLQDFVDEWIFKPMCDRMGFVEVDDFGDRKVIYPRLSFTRLALRDNQETFDAMFNLYQKGSLPIEFIYELLNIDPDVAHKKLLEDSMTIRDPNFNEIYRSLYSDAGRELVENSNAMEIIAKHLRLEYQKPEEEGGGMGRFASQMKNKP